MTARPARSRSMLVRQWTLVRELAERHLGLSRARLLELLGTSPATLHRDLAFLGDEVGIPIERETVNGEVRYRLGRLDLPDLVTTPLQMAALRLARESLSALEGGELVAQLDALLGQGPKRAQPAQLPLAVGGVRKAGSSRALRVLELALRKKRRARIVYRAASRGGSRATYTLDPLTFRLVAGDLYLAAWVVERAAVRTFKVVRIAEASVLDEAAEAHPDVAIDAIFDGAVKAWSGETLEVAVRLGGSVGWLAREYPLAEGQSIEAEEHGSVVVRATVAGSVEAMRWVLGWGAEAQVLAPEGLREAVRDELARALAGYDAARPPKPSDGPRGLRKTAPRPRSWEPKASGLR